MLFSPKFYLQLLAHYERENFSDSSFHHIFESEIFRLSFFSTKNSLWGAKCEKLNFRISYSLLKHPLCFRRLNIIENLLDELEKLYIKERSSRNF